MKQKFRMLSDTDHIKLRPGMYIGSVSMESFDRFVFGKHKTVTYVPGLVKIIEEILDNSIDEAVRTNFVNGCNIDVDIQPTVVTISDNGNGIPQGDILTPTGETIPQAVAAWTRAKAGSNFSDGGTQIGMNGVGSSLTNTFSKKFVGTTCDGKQKIVVTCGNGNTEVDWEISKSQSTGTTLTLDPDFEHFECTEINQDSMDIILDRLKMLSVIFPKLKFTFNGTPVEMNFKQCVNMYAPDESIAYVIQENQDTSIGLVPSDDGFKFVSYVNGLNTKNGGSHVDYIMDSIATAMIPIIKRKHKVDVNKSRIKECLTLICVIKNLKGMKFDSQTKERLTNTMMEVRDHMNLDIDKLVKQIMSKEELYMPIIESAIAKQLAIEKAALTKANNAAKKAKIAKHIQANKIDKPGEPTILILAEGDCIDENVEVFTLDGIKPIKHVKLGDKVLTHNHKFAAVTSYSQSLKSGIRINGVLYSPEHRLYVYDNDDLEFKFERVKNLVKNRHRLVSNSLIESGLYKHTHIITELTDTKFIAGDYEMTSTPDHIFLVFTLDGIVSKRFDSLEIGDCVLI